MASSLITITIKVSPEDLATIDACAKATGLNRTQYLIAQGCAPEASRALLAIQALARLQRSVAELGEIIDADLEYIERD